MITSRDHVIQQILEADSQIYQLISTSDFDQWLRVELTMPQLKVLLSIYSSDDARLRMGQLASALRVTLPTVTGIVDRLVDSGLVERLEDPHDRRLVIVELTPPGASLVDRLREMSRRELREVLDLLGEDDLQIVARALDLLLAAARVRQERLKGADNATATRAL